MNTKQTDRFRKLLLDQREEAAAAWAARQPPETGQGRDLEELAIRITRAEVADQVAEDDLQLIDKIDLALRRIDDGTYEQCIRCGQTIPMERLLAKPSVSLCLECQEEKDAAEAT